MKQLKSSIPHVTLVGNVNSGKSTIFNDLVNQEVAVVSDVAGTTTDLVYKRMELLDFGPIQLVDTPGINDSSELGHLRIKNTKKAIKESDLFIYIIDSPFFDEKELQEYTTIFNNYKTKYLIVFNKVDLLSKDQLKNLETKFPKALFVTFNHRDKLLKVLLANLTKNLEPNLITDIVNKGDKVLLVMPIDSEAPKGRIILPQMQVLRECLDIGAIAIVVQPNEIESTLINIKDIKIVITDSQVFREVEAKIPKNIYLTSFSILFAHQKGDLVFFVESCYKLNEITANSKILIVESCAHNVSHEDIGLYKIPKLLTTHLGFIPNITHKMSKDFPDTIQDYDFIIHCGSCMLNRKTVQSRIIDAKQQHIPMTNYGVIIAYLTNILEKSILFSK